MMTTSSHGAFRMVFLSIAYLLVVLFLPKANSTAWSGRWNEADPLVETPLAHNAPSSMMASTSVRTSVSRRRRLRRAAEAQIVGGDPVNSQQYPFFVQSDASVSGFVCGGSLVATDFVLTAAHCFGAYLITQSRMADCLA
jgi:Trypsin